MEKKSIRLGSTLTFDIKKERDMILLAEKLNETHRMGEFMSNLFRIAIDNPEIITGNGRDARYGREMAILAKKGITPYRDEFFKLIESTLKETNRKVDRINDMCNNMYALAEVGKTVGLQEKSVNLMRANFLVEKIISELCSILDINEKDIKEVDINDREKKSKDMLEYIITCYDGVIKEIKEDVKSNNSNEDVSSYVETIKMLRAENDRLTRELNDNKVKDENIEDTNVKLREALSENQRLKEENNNISVRAQEENEELRKEIRKLKNEKANLECDIDELRIKLKRASVNNGTTEDEVDDTSSERHVEKETKSVLDNTEEIVDFGEDANSISALESMLGL